MPVKVTRCQFCQRPDGLVQLLITTIGPVIFATIDYGDGSTEEIATPAGTNSPTLSAIHRFPPGSHAVLVRANGRKTRGWKRAWWGQA
jgi:hypothetical protein